MKLRFGIVCLAIAAAASVARAQHPVFHAEANYVEVDVVATDKQGQFVPGLSAGDFDVREAGAPQRIDTFTYVDLPVGPPAAAPAVAPARVDPELGLPAGAANGRLYLIFLDPNANNGLPVAGQLGDTRSLTSNFGEIDVRQRSREFVTRYLQPGDLAAVWNAAAPPSVLTFTTSQADLLNAIDGKTGVGQVGSSGEPTRQLRSAIDLLNGIQGRRKSLLLFTEGWPVLVTNQMDASGNFVPRVSSWFSGMVPFDPRFGSLAMYGPGFGQDDLTGRADVHIYTIDTRGLVAPGADAVAVPHYLSGDVQTAANQVSNEYSALSASTMALSSIADETGGLTLINSNDFSAGFKRVVDDNSRYYVLGYYSTTAARDGRFIPLQVKTSRPGLTIRARKGYLAR